jgi:amino acid adenylation domain-containing protein
MTGRKRLHEIFEDKSRQFADRVAVRAGNEQITYRELNDRADSLAKRLSAMGAAGDVLVGLCLERSVDLIVGVLGILKAGAAYLPIDPEYPQKRVEFILADSGTEVVVTTANCAKQFESSRCRIVMIDGENELAAGVAEAEPAPREFSDRDLAYVIYTSGSSGTPKGVLVEHYNVTRLFEATREWFHFDQHDTWTMFHSISFDFSVWEIWGALLHGGTLVIVPTQVVRSPELLQELIRNEAVTVLCQTPSAFDQFVAAEMRRPAAAYPLRQIILGGEALNLEVVRRWMERYGSDKPQLINMYGITETTVHVTWKRVTEKDLEDTKLSPIGVPIPDLEIHLLDETGEPVPNGAPGEIYVSGAGVARGYLNRPKLTAQRFLIGRGGERMYRSGDSAYRAANGELFYLSRIDDQIKVRGYRIEPREVELCLAKHAGTRIVKVMPQKRGDGDVRLEAYIVKQDVAQTSAADERLVAELAGLAQAELPGYMRPAEYFVVAELPVTANGKLDRAALLASRHKQPAAATEAMTPSEQTIAKIWQQVMQRSVGAHEDFFDSGGTSLAFMQILARVNEHFGLRLNGSELGEEASISCLSDCVNRALREAAEFEKIVEKL